MEEGKVVRAKFNSESHVIHCELSTRNCALEIDKPGSRQPRDPGSLTTCLASVAPCTRSRRRIAGTLEVQTPATFGVLALHGLRRCIARSLHRGPTATAASRLRSERTHRTGFYSSSTWLGLRLTGHPCAWNNWTGEPVLCSNHEDRSSCTGTPQRADSPSENVEARIELAAFAGR